MVLDECFDELAQSWLQRGSFAKVLSQFALNLKIWRPFPESSVHAKRAGQQSSGVAIASHQRIRSQSVERDRDEAI
jgi:hypothetical protein